MGVDPSPCTWVFFFVGRVVSVAALFCPCWPCMQQLMEWRRVLPCRFVAQSGG